MAADTRKGAKKPAQASAGRGKQPKPRKPPTIPRPLNTRQHLFALIYAAGNITQGEAYIRAGFKASGHAAEVCAGKLLKNAELKSIINGIRAKAVEKTAKKTERTLEGLLDRMWGIVDTPPGDIDERSPFCQEYVSNWIGGRKGRLRRGSDSEGNEVEDDPETEVVKIKMPCKLRAGELIAKLSGWLAEKGEVPPPPLKPAEEEIAHGRAVLERWGGDNPFAPRDVRGTEAG